MKLTEWLSEHDIADADFAARISVSRQALWRYKADERFPKPDVLLRIQKATKGAVTALDFVPAAERSAA